TSVAEKFISFETGWGVGIEEINSEGEIVFYPNPAGNNIHLKLNVKERCDVEIRIYNESGQLVKVSDKGKLTEGQHNIDLDMSRLNNGLYFAKVSIGNESVTKKIQIFK
ncbi:MAG: T9SS type A sorting domain-containing protein, partial [Bacteroidales bacterium]|nr:T9SS type A sorting domain-containing protein [Bacteroidales bacterium]